MLGRGSASLATEKEIALPVLVLIALYGVFAVRGQVDIAYQSGLKLTGWALLLLVVEQIAQDTIGPARVLSCRLRACSHVRDRDWTPGCDGRIRSVILRRRQ